MTADRLEAALPPIRLRRRMQRNFNLYCIDYSFLCIIFKYLQANPLLTCPSRLSCFWCTGLTHDLRTHSSCQMHLLITRRSSQALLILSLTPVLLVWAIS